LSCPLKTAELTGCPGTPLQNNKRELWNLLAFLDKTKDAEALDAKYAELTEENLPEIHAQIRPHMLRYKIFHS
jgi:SNF2 family DNA or RNA helicase